MTILRSTEPYGTFRVTYVTVTEESAEQGDFAESGWLSLDPQSDFWLSPFWRDLAGQDALGVTAAVHRPDWITDASWLRVCRLLGWRH